LKGSNQSLTWNAVKSGSAGATASAIPSLEGVEQQQEVVILLHRLLKGLQVVFSGRQRVARGLDQRVQRKLLGLICAVVHCFGIGQFPGDGQESDQEPPGKGQVVVGQELTRQVFD
jgi:hypothetical protein